MRLDKAFKLHGFPFFPVGSFLIVLFLRNAEKLLKKLRSRVNKKSKSFECKVTVSASVTAPFAFNWNLNLNTLPISFFLKRGKGVTAALLCRCAL